MKIVICHTDFRIYWPARIRALQSFLTEKRMELHIIEIAGKGSPYAFSDKTDAEIENWHILFPEREMDNIKGREIQKPLFEMLDFLQPEVVVAGAIAFPSGALCVNWAKRKNKGVIIFDDAKIEDVQRNKIVNFIKKRIYGNVDAALYPAQDWKATGRHWGFKPEQLFYGVNVIDNAFWRKKDDLMENAGEKYFLSVGRMIWKKNFLYIIDTYNQLKKNKINVPKLYIVGDGIEKEKINKYIEENQIDGVKLFPFLPQQELISLYQNAEAFILASRRYETWGLVINEAMAAGLPIIASNKCGATNVLLKEGINGYVIDPNQTSSLYEKLTLFLRLSHEEKEKMGKFSEEIIKEWNLDRFSNGVYSAILYALTHKKKCRNPMDKFILAMWKGRYRPV
jgi:glycosyltransferase involved in cell wall biosynthesis